MRQKNSQRTKTGSLRWRLTAVSLVLLTAVMIALDFAIYTGLRQRYYSELRADLDAAITHSYEVPWIETQRPSAIAKALSAPNVVAVVARQGLYPAVGEKIEFETPLPPIARAPATTDQSLTQFLIDLKTNPELIGEVAMPFGPSGPAVVFVTSEAPAKAELRRLLFKELIGTLLGLGIAVLAIMLVVRLALRPLDRMAAVAGRVSAGDLRQRIRPSKPSTELGKVATAFDAMLNSLADSLASEREAHETAALSEERMRDFLSDASHELRTPIAGLQWSAEALLRHGHRREQREHLTFQIAKQARRASRLVADLLAIARLDQGVALERESFDLAALAEEEVERLRELEPGLDVTLSSEGECVLTADLERIREVISNLLDNACKATARKGKIEVSVRLRDDLAELEVQDSGPGVPEADRERIFERFVRLDDSRLRSERGFGSGLGLAIARGIAEAHEGTLVCAPSDAGARFMLTIPIGVRAKRRTSARAARARA